MTKNFIKSFSVYGLFGRDNIHINFEEKIKILIGENGVGKTQVLNIFYYTLTRNFLKLSKLPFNVVEVNLGEKTIKINRSEIIDCIIIKNTSDIIERDISSINEELKETKMKLKNILSFYSSHSSIFQKNEPIQLSDSLINSSNEIKKSIIEKNILYFPTFRRVEEDLYNLGYDEEELSLNKDDARLIHFGMDDVQKRFNAIEKRIDSLLKEGFTKISSEILSKLVKGFGDTNKKVLDKISETDINIILARVGDQISDPEKDKIRAIVLNKEVSSTDNSLFYFIQTLVEIYEKQKEFDNSINKFKKVCNGYLIGKKVVYDESNIKIDIKSDNNDKPIELNKLSSGEKQIISIFSKIYLSEGEQRFIILFDEPELSLSMPWQKKLLPDILASDKCDFLLAVTHSPFIFDNELDQYAVGLNEYIQPQEKVTV